jgi:hypothetical protein
VAKKTTKSSFMSRLTEAHEEHKGDETKVGGGGELPPGIENGIARLVDAKIGVYKQGNNEGEPFFMAAGVVLEPQFHPMLDPVTKKIRNIPIEGLRTSIGPIPLCDTTTQAGKETPLADHYSELLNHLRLLGIETKDIDPTDVVAEDDNGNFISGTILEALVDAAPTFRFRTWQGKKTEQYPDPRVNHQWRGICPYDGQIEEDVQDSTKEEPQWESDAKKEEEAAAAEGAEAEVKAVDLVELAKVADTLTTAKTAKDKKAAKEAATEMARLAIEAGVENYEEIDTWVEVAEAIVNAMEGTDATSAPDEEVAEEEAEEYVEEDEVEEWKPVVGELAYFSPPGVKGSVQVQVMEIDEKAGKAVLKRLDTKKLVKGVPLTKIGPDEIPF